MTPSLRYGTHIFVCIKVRQGSATPEILCKYNRGEGNFHINKDPKCQWSVTMANVACFFVLLSNVCTNLALSIHIYYIHLL